MFDKVVDELVGTPEGAFLDSLRGLMKHVTGRDLLRFLQNLETSEPELLDLPVATNALGTTYVQGSHELRSKLRLVVLHHYTGDKLALGSFTSRIDHFGGDDYVVRELDGGPVLPDTNKV